MLQKKRLLYLGNKLAIHGKPPTAIDILSLKLREEGFSVITTSSIRNKFLRMFDFCWTIVKNRKKVDLVIIDTYSTLNFYYASMAASICRWVGLPYITILHGGNLPQRLKKNARLSKNLFLNAFTNVAPSQYIFKAFKNAGYHNLTFIPNSLDIGDYPFKSRKCTEARLLWVRSFAEIYNPLLALEIAEMLQKQDINVSLCMVGMDKDGSLARCKKVASDLNLPVSFPGILTRDEWISLSSEYDIFINTTNFDNMPISVMEAMALGLPVISTNVGGIPDLIENNINGILVPPRNAEAFVSAIMTLISEPKMVQEISKEARLKIEGFDWQQVKTKWLQVINV